MKNNIYTAILGVILGVVLTLSFSKVWEKRKFDGDYNRWRKLNLILQEVQKNYVDTIDMAGMTDAAVVASLAKLDPHSVYLPPVELTEHYIYRKTFTFFIRYRFENYRCRYPFNIIINWNYLHRFNI